MLLGARPQAMAAFDAVRDRYTSDDRLRVPPDITSFINNELIEVHLEL